MFDVRRSVVAVVAVVLAAAVGGACGGSKAGGLDYPGTADGGKALVGDMLKGDMAGMAAKLKPTREDIDALFDASVAADVMAHVDKMYGDLGGVGPKPGQSEVLFAAATSDDFKAGNDAAGKFPGGYKRLADKLKPGVTWYAWKFVKPGETIGMAFDGLVHVNGHWVWVPKPFRVVVDKGG